MHGPACMECNCLHLPENQRQKKIYIISSDTLVESPKIVEQISGARWTSMEKAAKEQNLPISTNLVRPLTKDSFWVCLLGLGYPAPSNSFRWCTDRLKIKNADRFITEKVSEYGEAIVVLGTRKDESTNRKKSMLTYEIENSYLVQTLIVCTDICLSAVEGFHYTRRMELFVAKQKSVGNKQP